jgi:hypothetical protein
MNNGRFSILEAVRSAYIFLGREWLYLLKAGMLPMSMQIISIIFVQFQRPNATLIEAYLWGLPATVLFSWFMFLEVRLLLLGERVDRLPQDRAYLEARLQAMKISVMMSVIFNMALTAALALLNMMAVSGDWGKELLITFAALALIGGIFWGVRFIIAPILAAVHYPIRPVLQQTWGMMFSLQLLGMAILSFFPVVVFFEIITTGFLSKTLEEAGEVHLTTHEQIVVITVIAVRALLLATVLNAAAAYALKQILGSQRGGVPA